MVSLAQEKTKIASKNAQAGLVLPAGLTPNVISAVVYLFQLLPIVGLAVSLIAFATSKDEFVRHNAVQAFFFSLFFTVLAIILVRASLSIAVPLLSLAVAIAFIFAAFKSYKGEKLDLPLVKEIAG